MEAPAKGQPKERLICQTSAEQLGNRSAPLPCLTQPTMRQPSSTKTRRAQAAVEHKSSPGPGVVRSWQRFRLAAQRR